jgi:hypothetical protein
MASPSPQLPGLSRADSYSVQNRQLEEAREKELINKSRQIIIRYNKDQNIRIKDDLNKQFIDARDGYKSVSEYKKILKRANKAKVSLDIDGAIVNALAGVTRQRERLESIKLNPATYGETAVRTTTNAIYTLKEVIDYLMAFPKSKRRSDMEQRIENLNAAVFKLIVGNNLSNQGYALITKYASKEGIYIAVQEMKLALVNTPITNPSAFRNIRGGAGAGAGFMTGGGMWQQGGFFMTCC